MSQLDEKREQSSGELLDRLRWLNANAHTALQVREIEVIERVLRERGRLGR